MTQETTPQRWRFDPPGREERRRAWRDTAARSLSAYLDAVITALAAEGFTCRQVRIGSGNELHARVSLVPTDPSLPGLPKTITLCWSECTGWSMTHSLLRSSPSRWRYLHSRLVPSPAAVAGFVALVLDVEDIAMLYPAQFRHHSQPLAPVIDALAEHAAPALPATGPARQPD
jgi:hypothetical protein